MNVNTIFDFYKEGSPRYVTIIHNETKEELAGMMIEYTPDRIVLQNVTRYPTKRLVNTAYVDAKDWHFKDDLK